jgi:Rrf2 family protein
MTPGGQNATVHVSSRADYGMRALLVLTEAYAEDPRRLVKSDAIAKGQRIPQKFLEVILSQLRQAQIVKSQRGALGGYRLARDPSTISVADVIAALDGPVGAVRQSRAEDLAYEGAAAHVRDVWVALRASMNHLLQRLTLADIASGAITLDRP